MHINGKDIAAIVIAVLRLIKAVIQLVADNTK